MKKKGHKEPHPYSQAVYAHAASMEGMFRCVFAETFRRRRRLTGSGAGFKKFAKKK